MSPPDAAAHRRPTVLVREAIERLASGEGGRLCGRVLDPRLRWRESGRNLVAGDYDGCQEVVEHLFARLRELSAGTFGISVETVAGDDRRLVAVCLIHATRGEHRIVSRDVCVLQMRAGLVAAGRIYHADQHAWDRFWSAAAAP